MKLAFLAKIRSKLCRSEFIRSEKQLKRSKAYVAKFSEPQNLFERSYDQYKCQKFATSNFLVNFFDRTMADLYLKKYLKNHLCTEPSNCIAKDNTAVFFNVLGQKIVPDVLKKEFDIKSVDVSHECLIEQDLGFISELKERYGKDKYFIFKTVCKIAQYRALIMSYNPVAIIATSEYSFTSSILTEFCRRNNVEHINVMHGEKLYDLMATFFEFDRCYVWDEGYIKMFVQRKAEKSQFIVEIPSSMKLELDNYEIRCDYKYYLADESKKELKSIRNSMYKLKEDGKKIMVRLHPLYTNIHTAKKIFKPEEIEMPKEVSIEQSIGESDCVISRYSTVLNQAYNSNRKVVVDDVSARKKFLMLRNLQYSVLDKKGIGFLSQLVK